MVKGSTRYIVGEIYQGANVIKIPYAENRARIFHGVSVANLPKQHF